MSILTSDTLGDGTDELGTGHIIATCPKAWVAFDASGTILIHDSLNHSTMTDHGTGLHTSNFTNLLVGPWYPTSGGGAANGSAGNVLEGVPLDATRTTAAFRFTVTQAGGTDRDSADWGAEYFGGAA